MVLSLAGSVSDVTPAALDAMRQAVAAEAGVPVAAVTASVAAGSVLLTFRIALQTEGEADAAAVALAEHVGDADAASTWLGAASGLAITVTEVITPPTKGALQPPAPPPPLSPPPAGPSGGGGGTPLGLIIGIVVGGLLLLCVLAAAIYKAKRVRVKALG